LPVSRLGYEARTRTGDTLVRGGPIATCKSSRGDEPERGFFQARMLKDRAERSASAVRERVRPALAIVRDESPDGHGLHRMREDANRGVVDPGRGAKQNYSILWAQLRRRLCHGLLSPPAFRKRSHRVLARRLVAVGWRAVVAKDERPHPWRFPRVDFRCKRKALSNAPWTLATVAR
jgi:hypothetical protein